MLLIAVGMLAAPPAWGQSVGISLSKTVGTTPAVCAATNNISVMTGTDVYYCFVATNTGDVTFEFHGLVDDHLGAILANFPYTLGPGASSPEVIVADTAVATVTNTATWTAATAIPGYTADDTINFDWEDISVSGTEFTLADDGTLVVPIGFTFDYFGVPYTDIEVSSNGFLSVNAAGNSGCCTGGILPDPTAPNGVIAGWWEDLDPGEVGAGLYYQTLGTAPNRYLVISFVNVQHFPSGNPVTMQYKLFEDGPVEVHYQAAPSDGGTHSAGLENEDGTLGVQYYRGPDPLAAAAPLAVRYTRTGVTEASAMASATVTIADPDITVDPASLYSMQAPDQVVDMPLTIGNVGVIDLDWTLEEEPVVKNLPQITKPAGRGDVSQAAERRGDVPDGKDPEWFPEAVEWSAPRAVLYDNGPLVTHPGGGAGGADASALQTAISMDTYGFGAQLSAGNRVADEFVVSDASGWTIDTITFFAYQTGAGNTSTITSVNLQIWDGAPDDPGSSVVWGDTSTNVMTSTTWSNIYRVLDTALTNTDRAVMACVATVGATLPQGTYWLDWQFDGSASFSGPWQPPITILGQTTTGNGKQYTTTGGWADLVDGVTGTAQGLPFIVDGLLAICGSLADVPWLSAAPTAGTIAPAGSDPVTVTFDSTGMMPGVYEATLCVFSNDPDEPVVPVPVTMELPIPVELMRLDIE